MSESKRQSLIMTGIGLIILSAVFIYFSLSQPRVLLSGESSTETGSSAGYISQATEISTQNDYPYNTAENETVSENMNVSFPINLNYCTVQELTAVEGIGESRAESIIQYREYLGGYTSVEQIKNIKGIGEGLYEKVSPYLTV